MLVAYLGDIAMTPGLGTIVYLTEKLSKHLADSNSSRVIDYLLAVGAGCPNIQRIKLCLDAELLKKCLALTEADGWQLSELPDENGWVFWKEKPELIFISSHENGKPKEELLKQLVWIEASR